MDANDKVEGDSQSQEFAAISQLRVEMHKLIMRYGEESDVTLYQVLGMLEVVKQDLMDLRKKPAQAAPDDEDDNDGEDWKKQ